MRAVGLHADVVVVTSRVYATTAPSCERAARRS
jgi:hypothetical protein